MLRKYALYRPKQLLGHVTLSGYKYELFYSHCPYFIYQDDAINCYRVKKTHWARDVFEKNLVLIFQCL